MEWRDLQALARVEQRQTGTQMLLQGLVGRAGAGDRQSIVIPQLQCIATKLQAPVQGRVCFQLLAGGKGTV
jgi:hypothetical protein